MKRFTRTKLKQWRNATKDFDRIITTYDGELFEWIVYRKCLDITHTRTGTARSLKRAKLAASRALTREVLLREEWSEGDWDYRSFTDGTVLRRKFGRWLKP